MKRWIRITALALMICALCGCSLVYSAYDKALPDNLARGIIEGQVYTSAYAGFSFTAPKGWDYATDEQLASMMDLSMDAMANAGMEFSEDAMEKQLLVDMMTTNTATGSNVLLQYENLALTGNTGMSAEKYLSYTKDQLEKADLIAYDFHDIAETEFCGQTYQMMQADMTDYGTSQFFYARKLDKYMVCIIVSVFGGDSFETISGGFAGYEPPADEA
jgi:hypothetical protein